MRLLILTLLLALAVACTKNEAPKAPVRSLPTAAPPAAGGLTGTVAETLDASTYTYLRLNTASGEVWAAIPAAKIAVGAQVTLANPQRMQNFSSKTLNRTFEVIFFSSGLAGEGNPAGLAPPQSPIAGLPVFPAMPKQGAPGAAAVPDEKVEKATGADARTVAEIFAQRAALKDKAVVLRGKVVKLTLGVLGKNWLHVRDGSGADATKDNDLTVTSTDTAALGDVVVVSGPVHLDRDFGAGYAYPVMIEDAKLGK